MEKQEAERILMRNLKGPKIKNASTLELAKASEVVKKNISTKEMTKLFDVSHTMLSRINKINKLTKKSKEVIKKSNLGIEQSYLLTQLPEQQQEKAAKAILDMTSHETRKFIRLVKNSEKSIDQCKKEFDDTIRKKFSLLVIPMPENLYQQLTKLAKKSKKDPHDLAIKVLEEYIHG